MEVSISLVRLQTNLLLGLLLRKEGSRRIEDISLNKKGR